MAEIRLLASAATSVGMAALLAYVGWSMARRPVQGPARTASRLFATWWFGFAAHSALSGAVSGLAGLGLGTRAVATGAAFLAAIVICVMFWGLMYYLLYLYTGSPRLLAPLTAAYALQLVGALALIAYLTPTHIEVQGWTPFIVYEHAAGPSANLFFALVFIAPPILGALAYARVFFLTEGRTQRYRIALVSTSILVWFTVGLVASALPGGDATAVATRVVGLLAVLAVLAAYEPPSWARRRYGLEALSGEAGAAAGAREAWRAQREAHLRQRAGDLV